MTGPLTGTVNTAQAADRSRARHSAFGGVPDEKACAALHEQSSAVTTRNYLWRWSSDNSDRIVLYYVLNVSLTSARPHQAPPTIDAQEGTQARRLFSLLDEWLADESGYDEETWPQLKEALDHGGVAMRETMSDE